MPGRERGNRHRDQDTVWIDSTLWAAGITPIPAQAYQSLFRDETGDAFAAGIVLQTGSHVFPLADHLFAAPVSSLWAP